MPKFNADTLAEPIEFTLEGKNYTVVKINTTVIKQVGSLTSDDKDLEAAAKQLSLLAGVDVKEFEGVDIRKIGAVLRFITESIKKDTEAINPIKAEAKQ